MKAAFRINVFMYNAHFLYVVVYLCMKRVLYPWTIWLVTKQDHVCNILISSHYWYTDSINFTLTLNHLSDSLVSHLFKGLMHVHVTRWCVKLFISAKVS